MSIGKPRLVNRDLLCYGIKQSKLFQLNPVNYKYGNMLSNSNIMRSGNSRTNSGIPLKPLYMSKSLDDLNTKTKFDALKIHDGLMLSKCAKNVFDAAVDNYCNLKERDEERDYVYFMRFVLLFDAIKKTRDYISDTKYFNNMFGADVKLALEIAETLSCSLEKRYSAITTEIKIEKEAQSPDNYNHKVEEELTSIETNGRKTEIRATRPSNQSPRTMPRCHTTQKRQVHNDIHSASASPSIPSRNAHQNINHGQANHSSQMASPQLAYGARSSNPSIQSPAGVQSLNSDSPSLVHGQDSNEDSTLVVPPATRKEALQHKVRTIVPKLTNDLRKGQCGRIAVFGGCFLYTGAPYFAAISALKCGADLVHVFCEKEAGNVIKSYSPELIVHPVLDTEYVLEEIDKWLPRLHCVVIGPGLGRNQSMLGRISIIMDKVKASNIPVVIDADGLWHLTNNPNSLNVIKGYRKAVLTPNAVEFSHLVHSVLKRGDVPPAVHPDPKMVAEVSKALGGVTIVHKGSVDVISNGKYTEHCIDDGCPRRCGGQGDLLSGSLAAFLFWAHKHNDCPEPGPGVIAGWAAARLSRACAAQAFSQHGRATTTTDLIAQLESAFSRLYESETCL